MKGNVTGHYVSVRPDLPEEVSKGGIVLAADYDEDHRDRAIAASITGTIVSVGPDAWKAFKSKDPWAVVGDKVLYVKHVSKIFDDPDVLDRFGKPTKIFIIADENIVWNFGQVEDKDDE